MKTSPPSTPNASSPRPSRSSGRAPTTLGRTCHPRKPSTPAGTPFILHTEDYADFCQEIASRFIHHRPVCNEDIRSGTALGRTVEALKATGYPIDWELWTVDQADCHQCHATCHDSP